MRQPAAAGLNQKEMNFNSGILFLPLDRTNGDFDEIMKLIEILDTEPHIEEVNVDYNMSNFLELWSGFRMVNLTAVVSLFVHPTLYD